jgi:hypothetical protein
MASCFLLWLCFFSTRLAAQPLIADTTTLSWRKHTWHPCIITWNTGQLTPVYMRQPIIQKSGKWKYLTKGRRNYSRKTVRATDIRSIDFAQSRYQVIENAKGNRWRLFLEAVTGEVTLYLYTEQNKIPIPVPSLGGLVSIGIPYQNTLFYLRRNGELLEVEKTTFMAQMQTYFQDDSVIVARITDKTYRYRDMVSLVTAYNDSFKARKPTK